MEGRRHRGKPQLTADECRRFRDAALEQPTMVAAVVLLPLLSGVDGREITGRKVRDLDEGGRVLIVRDGKTKHRDGRVPVPSDLRPPMPATGSPDGTTSGRGPWQPARHLPGAVPEQRWVEGPVPKRKTVRKRRKPYAHRRRVS